MRFTLEIDMENEAFSDHGELPRLLEVTAHKVREGANFGNCFDANGNNVGRFIIEER